MGNPDKTPHNADAWIASANSIGVFDGVSGSEDFGFNAAALSNQLSSITAEYLQTRFDPNTNPTHFDDSIRKIIEVNAPKQKGEWLRNLVTRAALRTSVCGGTTVQLLAIKASKVYHYTLGDSLAVLYRYDPGTREMVRKFQTDPVFIGTKRHLCGFEQKIPGQLFTSHQSNITCDIVKSAFWKGTPGIWEVEKGDVVVAFSDGVFSIESGHSNVSLANLDSMVHEAYWKQWQSPTQLAETIVKNAHQSGVKKDDVTCVVGYVVDMD